MPAVLSSLPGLTGQSSRRFDLGVSYWTPAFAGMTLALNRHPEVAAKRPSKDAPEASSFRLAPLAPQDDGIVLSDHGAVEELKLAGFSAPTQDVSGAAGSARNDATTA
jgi:hypothetical protein